MKTDAHLDASILIADDEPANIALLEALLQDEGYHRIRSTSDPREVLPLVDAEQPDLILLDLHMPRISGIDVMRQLRKHLPPDVFLPVLVLTADVTSDAKQRALAGGARDFLTKPIDATEVGLRIRNLLEVRQLHLHQQSARAAAEVAERRATLLADVSTALASSFDFDTTLGLLARLLVPQLGDACVVTLSEDATSRVVGLAHRDSTVECELAAAARALESDAGFGALLDRLGTAPHGAHEDISAAGIAAQLPGALGAGVAGTLQPRTAMIIPLEGTAGRFGTLLLLRADPLPYAEAEISLADDIAYRASVARENASLFQQAQLATRARDEMLGIVAHDLRNPLNAIFMSGEMLLETVPAGEHPQRRPLEVILRASSTMQRLIEDLLDVQRMETQGIHLDLFELDIAVVVRQAAEMLRPLAHARRLELELRESGTARVAADPTRLHQVVSNLVGNAIKFTPEGGRVEIAVGANSDEAVVCVVDSGPGIASDQLPHVFSRYWQAKRGDRRGIGMGLAIARGIVEAHRGRIWAESPPGGGAAFSFTVPLLQAQDAVPLPAPAPAFATRST